MSLYQQLLTLTNTNEAFYFKDFTYGVNNEKTYRLFNYLLCSTNDWLMPAAIEARGIVFDITDENNVFCLSRPMKKFFNYKENALVSDISFKDSNFVMDKIDGSLMSSFTYVNPQGEQNTFLKSKGSFYSEQAKDANVYLNKDENKLLKNLITKCEILGYTVNMEYTAPHNRIVVRYPEEKLTILNLRHRETGEYILPNEKLFSLLENNNIDFNTTLFVQNQLVEGKTMEEFVQSIYDDSRIDFEGVVIEYGNGEFVKVKSKVYLAAHSLKGGIMDGHRKLYEVIVNEQVDDVKAALFDDVMAMEKIVSMESYIVPQFNHIIHSTQDFVEQNKHLDIKTFALKAQEDLGKSYTFAMNMYRGKKMDWKQHFILQRDKYLAGWKEPKAYTSED